MEITKAIILAGGTGSRLFPITKCVCKQLHSVYDKPMIYYPLTTIMSSGIRDILIITTPHDNKLFQELLNDGTQLGININYAVQNNPNGLAEAFIIAEEFIDRSPTALILGDNIFHGEGLVNKIQSCINQKEGATIFAYEVKDPERYGVAEFNSNKEVLNIEEKPSNPKSNFAITGIYFFDYKVVDYAKSLKPSKRGELEITDLHNIYLRNNQLKVEILGGGIAWLDTGTFESLYEAAGYIKTIENRQGIKIGCPEEISWRMGWINDHELEILSRNLMKSNYGEYLMQLIKKKY